MDGWIKQCGRFTGAYASVSTETYTIAFSDTNYYMQLFTHTNSDSAPSFRTMGYSLTTTGFTVFHLGVEQNYIAEGY